MRTPKPVALGIALKQARENRGYSQRELAKILECNPSDLSRWENGERIPRRDRVVQILTRLEVSGREFDDVMKLMAQPDEPRWVAISLPEQRRQSDALIDFEQKAKEVRALAPLLVPGLLQTDNYVKAIMTAGDVPAGEIASRVATRIGRRAVLTRTDPPPVRLVAYIGEAVLRQLVGSRAVMLEQVKHLQDVATWPNVELRVVPFDSGWHPMLEGPCLVIESEDETVVHLEVRGSVLFLHEEQDVNTYREAVATVSRAALSRDQSAEVIAQYVQVWEKAA